MTSDFLNNFIKNALEEDIGDGDHTSLACVPSTNIGKAKLLVKEKGIIAGVLIAKTIFKKFDPNLKIQEFIADGERIKPGDIVFIIEGKSTSILQTERLVLNILQRMSGIATETNKYVEKLKGLNTRILDTRKTTPGFRFFEKEAVKIGGGTNHRMGLYDMIMIKDNHVDFSGGISNAINNTINYLEKTGRNLKIEIEARNFSEIQEILNIGKVNRIMLDNFSIKDTEKAVQLINSKYETESSGGITLETVRGYAECGVDFISVGALTHHIKSLDLSLKAI